MNNCDYELDGQDHYEMGHRVRVTFPAYNTQKGKDEPGATRIKLLCTKCCDRLKAKGYGVVNA